MKRKEKNALELKKELFCRYPQLNVCAEDIEKAYSALKKSHLAGGKILTAGNGGSAADAEHIVGELMKSFIFNRKIDATVENGLKEQFGEEGLRLSEKLEGTIQAIPLTSMPALTSAFANDVDSAVAFAQMVYGYGNSRDVFWGISTSGNSRNILYALMVAKAKGITTIVLTGGNGGKCAQMADILICVPEVETFKIQELHLPIYHALCAMLEAECFEEKK